MGLAMYPASSYKIAYEFFSHITDFLICLHIALCSVGIEILEEFI